MDLVIMAAGMGSRFGGSKQTQIVGYNDEFIIDYSIYDAIRAGFNRVIFIIRKENLEEFEESIGKRIKKYIEVLYVFQDMNNLPIKIENLTRIKPWGTGHALLSVKDIVKDKFVIINADDFYGRDAFIKIYDYLKNNDNYALVGYKLINTLSKNGTVSRGVCSYKDGYLDRLNERLGVQIRNDQISYIENDEIKTIDKNSNVSVNFFGLDAKIFKYAEQYFTQFLTNPNTDLLKSEFYLPTIVQNMIDENIIKMKVIETDDVFCGITYKEDLFELKEHIDDLIKKGVYPDKLWQ
ncbi:MAG: nucleotidyltransferase [Bacilli bacterium]|nr:nucleotidyltransferase [Bacilli bacterium]